MKIFKEDQVDKVVDKFCKDNSKWYLFYSNRTELRCTQEIIGFD